jgi:rod shape-determining protein MreD
VNVSVAGVLRLCLLVVGVVVFQIAVVGQINMLDANADLLPLVALSVGLLAGPVTGATVGFLLGLVADMALLQTLGVTSLLLIGVGYLAGRYRELRDATHKMVPVVGGLVATVAYAAAFSLVQFLLGVESPVSPLVIREILIGALLNAVVAMPVFAAVRALLRSDLTDDLRPRRRRGQTTTRRGPLTGAPLTSSAVTITGPATRPRRN